MIPLSRWLAERAISPPFVLAPDVDAGAEETGGTCALQLAADLAFARGRSAGLAEAGAQFDSLQRGSKEAAERREEELAATWAARCGGTIALKIEATFAQLRASVEQQLHLVLMPFLEDQTRRQAIAELSRLLGHEMSRTSGQALEIRAPAAALAPLQDELDRLGISAILAEDGSVEVKAREHTARFESMAARWIETLRGPPDDE